MRFPIALIIGTPWLLFEPLSVAAAAQQVPLSSRPLNPKTHDGRIGTIASSEFDPAGAFETALGDLQSHFFTLLRGTWPSGNDWTRAVTATYVAASLSTISRTTPEDSLGQACDPKLTAEGGDVRDSAPSEFDPQQTTINHYFSQLIAFYYGQNVISLRRQAYDDMLWVVLGWLEAIKFIKLHTELHHPAAKGVSPRWYGEKYNPTFTGRAIEFYELASHGWDEMLCGGGMLWNPNLRPYKNSITNELYIAASMEMYHNIPEDRADQEQRQKYLDAALRGHAWLMSINMVNDYGLLADGVHVRGYQIAPNGTVTSDACDLRNERVYTYNQGVLLTGLRGLYEATGNETFMHQGYELIEAVYAATHWQDDLSNSADDPMTTKYAMHQQGNLGKGGIIEEACDPWGMCSQDGQTFKGIFFHHLTRFCSPLDRESASEAILTLQAQSCHVYAAWITKNAEAAWATRSEKGVIGSWWRLGLQSKPGGLSTEKEMPWRPPPGSVRSGGRRKTNDPPKGFLPLTGDASNPFGFGVLGEDLNDRGRGRTLESQGGGLSVLRALREWSVWDHSAVDGRPSGWRSNLRSRDL